jgi:formylglycine-generating enzyme required for sulfatase activity
MNNGLSFVSFFKDILQHLLICILLLTLLEDERYLGQAGLVSEFLDYVDRRAGLLIGRGGDSAEGKPALYSFPHRTFQEYLAGCSMVTDRGAAREYWQRVREGDTWYLAAQLGAEELLYNNPQGETLFLDLAYELCPEQAPQDAAAWRACIWSGYMARQVGRLVIERDEAKPGAGLAYWKRLQERLPQALAQEGWLPAVERAEAGRILAAIGDDRPGVGLVKEDGLLIPDGISYAAIAWGEEVPAGKYEIGGDRDAFGSFKNQQVVIERPYRLSRYPVTNAQFQSFIDAPDREDGRWWQGIPADERKFDTPYFPFANHPRESVSWYQAVAFCRWLGDKLGYPVDLSHEYEWEVAARYPDGRFYPWGSDFEVEKANIEESGLGQTTAVGLYPSGKNPALDLYDLSGNVWEWCRNEYDKPDETWLDKDPMDGSGDWRVLRGGSWSPNRNAARAAARFNVTPFNRYSNLGFRLVVRRSPSHP